MDLKTLSPVSRVPLSEKVYQVLMDSIMDGSLPPGTELREQHIAKQLSVSTTPVREAFKRLASDGMVDILPYRGAMVKQLDAREIAEAYACREALEHLAVQQAIAHVTDQDIQTLRKTIEEYRTSENSASTETHSQAFDEYIYRLAGNSTLHSLLSSLGTVISRDRKYSSASQERKRQIYEEHQAIVDALEQRNVELAQQAVSNHIQNGLTYISKKC